MPRGPAVIHIGVEIDPREFFKRGRLALTPLGLARKYDLTPFGLCDTVRPLTPFGLPRYAFEDDAGVRGRLFMIAAAKSAKRRRYLRAGKRDWRRDVTLDERLDVDGISDTEALAIRNELIECLVADYEEGDRPLIRMILEGRNSPEIVAALGVSLHTLQRIGERFLEWLTQDDDLD